MSIDLKAVEEDLRLWPSQEHWTKAYKNTRCLVDEVKRLREDLSEAHAAMESGGEEWDGDKAALRMSKAEGKLLRDEVVASNRKSRVLSSAVDQLREALSVVTCESCGDVFSTNPKSNEDWGCLSERHAANYAVLEPTS